MASASSTASSQDDTARPEPRPSPAELKAAAVRLLGRHERTLRRTARRFSICADDADDAFQRALEILLTKAPTTTELDLLRWMQTVTKHEALGVRRQRERILHQPPPTDSGDELDPIDSLPTDSAGPGERAERVERVERSREALSSLKPHEAQALTLKAEGYSYAEIGTMTGWSYTKINRLMAEGRKRFLEVFRGIEGGDRCEAFAGFLELAAEGRLEREPLRDLRQHLRACGSCRADLRALRGLPQGAFAWLAPVLLAWRAWTARLRHLGEITVSQKAAATVATVAVTAGGGAAIERHVHHPRPERAPVVRSAPSGRAPEAPVGPVLAVPKVNQPVPAKGRPSGQSVHRRLTTPKASAARVSGGATPGAAPTPKPASPRLPSGGSEEFGL
jgi:RNA polymerase sigma factor (sigma-70 family)